MYRNSLYYLGNYSVKLFFKKKKFIYQQAHKKVLSIANGQGNANQNHNEVSPHFCQNGHHQKGQLLNVGEDEEKREPSYTVGGNVN